VDRFCPLNVDSALFGAGMLNFQNSGGFSSSQYTPMEIGNFEQRNKDRKKNACFKCHKVGCRPWKCGKGTRGEQAHQVKISNSNVGTQVRKENLSMNGSVTVNDLIVLDGSLEGKRVRVLKDDGCNTNVVSHEFFKKT